MSVVNTSVDPHLGYAWPMGSGPKALDRNPKCAYPMGFGFQGPMGPNGHWDPKANRSHEARRHLGPMGPPRILWQIRLGKDVRCLSLGRTPWSSNGLFGALEYLLGALGR